MEGAVSETAHDHTTTAVTVQPVASPPGSTGRPPDIAAAGIPAVLEPAGLTHAARRRPDPAGGATGTEPDTADQARAGATGWPYRQRTTVSGVVTEVRAWTGSRVMALEAVVAAESGPLSVVWMGRRSLGGVRPGRCLTVSGTVGQVDGRPVVFNPRYELLPQDGGLSPAESAPAGKTTAPTGNGD